MNLHPVAAWINRQHKCVRVSLSETQCKIKIFTNAFLLLHGSRVSNLNVTSYSNAYVLRARFVSLSPSRSRSQSLTDAYARKLFHAVIVSELGWMCRCAHVDIYIYIYTCHVCFDLMRSFCYIALLVVSVCLCVPLPPSLSLSLSLA